jgi:nitrite reductase/ring-hydroxylating ferredoxin subunit
MTDAPWTDVLVAADLPGARLTRVEFGDAAVLLYRKGDQIFAIGARCTHAGMPLQHGPVKVSGSDVVLTCPAHGSQFRVADGRVLRGPAAQPLPSFDVQESDGRIQLRPR